MRRSSPAAGDSAAGGTHVRPARRCGTWRSCRNSYPPRRSLVVWCVPGVCTTGPSCRLADPPVSSAGLPPSSCGEPPRGHLSEGCGTGGGAPPPPVLRASRNWLAHPRGNSGHGGGNKPYAAAQRTYAHTDPHGVLHRSTPQLCLEPEPAKAYPGWWQPGPPRAFTSLFRSAFFQLDN